MANRFDSEDFGSSEPEHLTNPSDAARETRRKLLRAGLSAAPVMLAFKTQSVLATTSTQTPVTCSAFSSLYKAKKANTALSRVRGTTTATCNKHSYWAASNITHPGDCDDSNKKCYFHSSSGSGSGGNGVVMNSPRRYNANFSGGTNSTKTLRQLCATPPNDLTKYCVAAYLNAIYDQGRNQTPLLTPAQCKAIWAGNGVWTPVLNQPAWTAEQTMAFFKYCIDGLPVA